MLTCPFLRKAGAAAATPAGQAALCALAAKCPHMTAAGLHPSVVLARLAAPPPGAPAAGQGAAAAPGQLSSPCGGEQLAAPCAARRRAERGTPRAAPRSPRRGGITHPPHARHPHLPRPTPLRSRRVQPA